MTIMAPRSTKQTIKMTSKKIQIMMTKVIAKMTMMAMIMSMIMLKKTTWMKTAQ